MSCTQSNSNADKIGDFANKQFSEREGKLFVQSSVWVGH